MSFEKLSYRYTHTIPNFPLSWLTFVHLFDPDLPLFPLYYFHVLPAGFSAEKIPRITDRAFGFVEKIHLSSSGLEVSIICNKDLACRKNETYQRSVISEIEERLGISNPATIQDISTAFQPPYCQPNQLLIRIWHRVVSPYIGNSLPFGRFFDRIFGLIRWVSSFYSPGGRKSEWIQTHYFLTKFGVRIAVEKDLPQVIFFLLPTFEEVSNLNNPLRSFSKFGGLLTATEKFHQNFCKVINIGGMLTLSKFNRPLGQKVNTNNIQNWINSLGAGPAEVLTECFNAFDKGPLRTIIFLQMLSDVRNGRLPYQNLTPYQGGLIYDGAKGTYQSPKVLSLYSQQCFGNVSVLPIDEWIETFMKCPLRIYPVGTSRISNTLNMIVNSGKVERLFWITAQARKVHSPLCDDILWCTKYALPKEPRGANPLACTACRSSIRSVCPAYANIVGQTVSFNTPGASTSFKIYTSANNNYTPDQRFKLCEGRDVYGPIHDHFTPVDTPNAFKTFPQPNHGGQNLKVGNFVRIYGR